MNEQAKDVRTIPVLSYNVNEALAALKKLAAKAQRYGCADITVEVGRNYVVDSYTRDWDGNERKIKVEMTDLLVTGDAPRYGNHEFLARVELHEGGNLVDTRPGVDDLEHKFRESDGYCEHCKKRRKRQEVYVVRDLDSGRQLAVGRNCLRDYLGIDDPAKIAHRFALWRSLDGDFDEDGYGPRGKARWCQSLEGILALAAVTIRLFGWCSKGQAQNDAALMPTSMYVYNVLFGNNDKAWVKIIKRIEEEVCEKDMATARATIDWVRTEMKGDSDYAHNLKVIFTADNLHDEKRIGLVISAVAAYHRDKELELRRTKERAQAAESKHLGEVGQRLRGMKVTLQMQRVIGHNDFGESILVKFVDEAGNTITWITGKGCELEIGEQALLDGTIKALKTFNGAAETQLTRCKVYEPKEKAA